MFKSILFILLGLAGIVFAVWALGYERHHDTTGEPRRGFVDWIRDLAYACWSDRCDLGLLLVCFLPGADRGRIPGHLCRMNVRQFETQHSKRVLPVGSASTATSRNARSASSAPQLAG